MGERERVRGSAAGCLVVVCSTHPPWLWAGPTPFLPTRKPLQRLELRPRPPRPPWPMLPGLHWGIGFLGATRPGDPHSVTALTGGIQCERPLEGAQWGTKTMPMTPTNPHTHICSDRGMADGQREHGRWGSRGGPMGSVAVLSHGPSHLQTRPSLLHPPSRQQHVASSLRCQWREGEGGRVCSQRYDELQRLGRQGLKAAVGQVQPPHPQSGDIRDGHGQDRPAGARMPDEPTVSDGGWKRWTIQPRVIHTVSCAFLPFLVVLVMMRLPTTRPRLKHFNSYGVRSRNQSNQSPADSIFCVHPSDSIHRRSQSWTIPSQRARPKPRPSSCKHSRTRLC